MTYGIEVDIAPLLASLAALGNQIDRELKAASGVTADAIVREAQGRLQRQLGPDATGLTVAGIVKEETTNGYFVRSTRNPFPMLPRWLEKGTDHMRARPFFDASVRLEEGGHFRRIEEAVTNAIESRGLGE